MALAVPGELAVTHALFGDTPLLFFTDLFVVELVAVLLALPLFGFAELIASLRNFEGEGIAAFIVLVGIGAPVIVWVVVRGGLDHDRDLLRLTPAGRYQGETTSLKQASEHPSLRRVTRPARGPGHDGVRGYQ